MPSEMLVRGGFSKGVICSQPLLEVAFTFPGLGVTVWKPRYPSTLFLVQEKTEQLEQDSNNRHMISLSQSMEILQHEIP